VGFRPGINNDGEKDSCEQYGECCDDFSVHGIASYEKPEILMYVSTGLLMENG
jgi:hypothetical protein